MSPPRGRIAPTPSGYLHRGNLLNFLVNAALVGPGGSLLLRIDDLDRSRYRPEYLENCFDLLDTLGIGWTAGPRDRAQFDNHWSQEHRLPLYHTALEQLRDSPRVYACTCTRKQLATAGNNCREQGLRLDTPGAHWRFATHDDALPDFAIRDKHGHPAYQLACTVDDHHFGINVVARGKDLLPSTLMQAALSDALGYPPLLERIDFLHHDLIKDAAGNKLSKSAGAQSTPLRLTPAEVSELRRLAAAIVAKR